MSAPAKKKRAKRGQVVAFPAVQGKPVELLNYLAGQVIDPKVRGLMVILHREDGSIDLRCFGRAHRRDVIVGLIKLQRILVDQEMERME